MVTKTAVLKDEDRVFNTAFMVSQPQRGGPPEPYPRSSQQFPSEKMKGLIEENVLALGTLADARVFTELDFLDVAAIHEFCGTSFGSCSERDA